MENRFIDEVTGLIQDKTAKKLIAQELEAHILDKADYYAGLGYSRDEALEKATEDMGNPGDAAVPLNALHSVKWYKNKLNILSIILLVAVTVVSAVFSENFCYTTAPYSYITVNSFWVGDDYYNVLHRIGIDFMSFAIFAAYILLLHLSRKRKNMFVAVAVGISLVCQIIANFISVAICYIPTDLPYFSAIHFTSWFEPMLFAVFTVAKSGFSGYADSIFSYSFTSEYLSGATACVSTLLFVLLIVWSLILAVTVYRQQRAKSSRVIMRIIKIAGRAAAIFLAANAVLMTSATTVACANLNDKISESRGQRKNLYDCVISADMTLPADRQIERLKEFGIGTENNLGEYETDLYFFNQNNCMLTLSETYEDNNAYDLGCFVTTAYDDYVPLNSGLFFGKNDFGFVTDELTLKEFLNTDIYADATSVYRHVDTDADGKTDGDYIVFRFTVKDGSDCYEYTIEFKNGAVYDYYADFGNAVLNTTDVTEEEPDIPKNGNNLSDFNDKMKTLR